ncbi:MAG: YdeI/OmpD-associated family protein [Synechococcales bacterium]|nr:YdeI/OmpD-associated family protein [Synechococcales bacterium]
MNEVPPNSTHPLSREEWRDWLAANHQQAENVWLITYKKSTGKPTLSYDDAVEEALCFGWIDSLPRKLDDERKMLYFAPRKPGSGWSRPNKERVERMVAAEKMAPAGLAKVEAAKADGSWTALDEIENLTIPDDLAAALAELPPAAENWEAFPRSVKRGVLEWIASAKREATRRKRVEETAQLAQRNERANQWKPERS